MRRSLLVFVVLTGCAQQARLPAPYFAETGHVLPGGGVAVTAVGGAGFAKTAADSGIAVGGGGRVRVGIGHGQELGVEASQMEITAQDNSCTVICSGDLATAKVLARSALVSWKTKIGEHTALVTRVGLAQHWTLSGEQPDNPDLYGNTINGSLGIVGTVREASANRNLYVGGNVSYGQPIGPNNDPNAKIVFGTSGVIGIAAKTSEHTRLFLEAGEHFLGTTDGFWSSVGLSGVVGATFQL